MVHDRQKRSDFGVDEWYNSKDERFDQICVNRMVVICQVLNLLVGISVLLNSRQYDRKRDYG